jgi:hypothetical protein
MKKLLVITTLVLFAGVASGQILQKGNLLKVHNMTITLKHDVTMDQYLDFTINTFFPEMEKHFQGVKCFIMQGGSGDNTNDNDYATLIYFESAEVFSKYFDDGGNFNDGGFAVIEKMGPTFEKLEELGTTDREEYGWMIL